MYFHKLRTTITNFDTASQEIHTVPSLLLMIVLIDLLGWTLLHVKEDGCVSIVTHHGSPVDRLVRNGGREYQVLAVKCDPVHEHV